jgi:hypothetical protein
MGLAPNQIQHFARDDMLRAGLPQKYLGHMFISACQIDMAPAAMHARLHAYSS